MSFAIRSLSVLAYAQGFTLWHYASRSDKLAEIGRANFFAPAADMLTGGDMLLISAPDGGRASMIRLQGKELETVALG